MGRFVMEPIKSQNGCFISVFATLLILKCKTWLELYFLPSISDFAHSVTALQDSLCNFSQNDKEYK